MITFVKKLAARMVIPLLRKYFHWRRGGLIRGGRGLLKAQYWWFIKERVNPEKI